MAAPRSKAKRWRRSRAAPLLPLPLSLPLPLLVLLAASRRAAAATIQSAPALPYVPTQMLAPTACFNRTSCSGRDVAYLFSPPADGSAGPVRFLALNYSTGLDAAVRPQTVTDQLPFLAGAPTTAFAAARAADGRVLVYAGACDAASPGNLWAYTTDAGWVKKATRAAGGDEPYFIGGALAFSSRLAPVMDEPTLYSYGGMCAAPAPPANARNWQADANYTRAMTSLVPAGGGAYDVGLASVAGPRTPFAGFSVTQLAPSVTNISGTVSQQASFVFLGGHTRSAFINMSTAAVWSLPEEAWSYVSVQPPAGIDGADAGVYSRSGHTAVLSNDGASIVVLGGWVGDVDTPATPQLAVLDMGQGSYSSWRWRVPTEQPPAGVYGHGAAVLPGNVMAVYGGWEMAGSSAAAASRRQAAPPASSLRFLNLSSMAWTSSYANPNAPAGPGDEPHEAPGASGSPESRRLGLGLGLGLGLALLLGIIFCFLFWRIRQRRRRARRDEAVRAMAADAKHFLHHDDDDDDGAMAKRGDVFGWSGQRDWRPAAAAGERALGYEDLRGAGAGLVSPAAAAVSARRPAPRIVRSGYHQPAEVRLSAFSSPPGAIHPILEDDEDAFDDEEDGGGHLRPDEPLTPTSDVLSDPFLTPVAAAAASASATHPPVLFSPPPARASAPPSPESPARRTDPDVQDWVSDVDAADALLARYSSAKGRSPTRRTSDRSTATGGRLDDDGSRTGSNLSESTRSATDSLVRRSASGRRSVGSLFLHHGGGGGGGGGGSGSGSGAELPKPSSSSSSSYNTARSGFGALQAEAPGLLHGGASAAGAGAARAAAPGSPTSWDDDEDQQPGSPSKSKSSRRSGWLGSLRRVFSNSSPPGTSSQSTTSRDDSPRRLSFEGAGAATPERPLAGGLTGGLLRRKQGRQDWEDGADAGAAADAAASPENDWDIERAVEKRLVQVMFTVPRKRLRVVNGGDDGDDGGADGRSLPDKEGGGALTAAEDGAAAAAPEAALQEESLVAELVEPSSTKAAAATTTTTTTTTATAATTKGTASSLRSAPSREGGVFLGPGAASETEPSPGFADTFDGEEAEPERGGGEAAGDRRHEGGPAAEAEAEAEAKTEGEGEGGDADADATARLRWSRTPDRYSDQLLGVAPSSPRPSHSTDGSGRRSLGAVFTAEAVTFERPRARTRVREMVDRFESRSVEASPARSQADGPAWGR